MQDVFAQSAGSFLFQIEENSNARKKTLKTL